MFKSKRNIIILISLLCFFLTLSLPVLAVKLQNPLGDIDGFTLFSRILQAVLGFVGVLALLNFVIAGIRLLTSQGKPEAIKSARDNMLWTVIAIVLLFGSYTILSFVISTLTGK